MATEKKEKLERKEKDEHRMLLGEIEKLQTHVLEANNKNLRVQKKLAIAKNRELALMQTNRTLIDLVKSYADREAVVLAGWKTMHETFKETITFD